MSKVVKMDCGKEFKIELPEQTDIISMKHPEQLDEPENCIKKSLENPINSQALSKLVSSKIQKNKEARAVIVISDNTRPVPYKGKQGILWPVVKTLIDNGVKKENILILVATGTHRKLNMKELKEMIDSRIFAENIKIKNHDCQDRDRLSFLGKTSRGSRVYINKEYMDADIKILTGLVESHFMAGASGGRKSVCPGIIGEKSTYVFHGAKMLNSDHARDLILKNNPCHEESLEVAKMAGVDFIINVTLDNDFNVTGVYSGDLEKAHQQAVKNIKKYVAIPVDKEYDVVVTHAGFVGINHYQSAKVGVVAIPLLKPDGKLILAANTTDDDPVGSTNYRTTLHLLKKFGALDFNKLILSPDWKFIPEQWQVQMWAKLFAKIDQDNLIYYSPQLKKQDYQIIPGKNGNMFLPDDKKYNQNIDLIPEFIENALKRVIKNINRQGKKDINIGYLIDGPYGIPMAKER